MWFRKLWIVLWMVIPGRLSGQPLLQPHWVCQLPGRVAESSGLVYAGNGLFWTHGDSGTPPVLYAFDSTGQLIDSIVIAPASNTDWEALAADSSGYLYIGDVGNNLNNRTDLSILKIWPDTSSDSAQPSVISFHYPDQTHFPAPGNFDCEAMFFWRDSLYLLSKNLLTGRTGYSKLYRLPADPGNYTAELLDSFYTGFPVTGADYDPVSNQLAVLCYGKLFWFRKVSGGKILGGPFHEFLLPLSQSEAIAFADSQRLYFTNEAGQMWRVHWPVISGKDAPGSAAGKQARLVFCLGGTCHTVTVPLRPGEFPLQIEIYDASGRLLLSQPATRDLPVTVELNLLLQPAFFRLVTNRQNYGGHLPVP